MAALIPNMAKGKFARYSMLPETNDALLWILYSGTETDDNIRDADTIAAVEATALAELTAGWYARVTASGVTVTVDDTNNRVDVDITTDPSWSPTTAVAVTRIIIGYDPDTTVGTDADLIPLFVDDFALTTPTSGTITYQVASSGWGRAS